MYIYGINAFELLNFDFKWYGGKGNSLQTKRFVAKFDELQPNFIF